MIYDLNGGHVLRFCASRHPPYASLTVSALLFRTPLRLALLCTMTRSFSLGNALFENPIAPFLRTLARDYLDGPDRVAVALTCKASLEWFLQDWQTATLRLGVRPTGDELTERLLRRTQRAKQRLLLRGQHATTVQLKQQHSMTDSDVGWMVTLNALASTGKVSALGLTLQHLSAQNLTIVGQALPNLTTLTLSHPEALDGAFKLPPPCALPTLRHLKLQRIALIAQVRHCAPRRPRTSLVCPRTACFAPCKACQACAHILPCWCAPRAVCGTALGPLWHSSRASTS